MPSSVLAKPNGKSLKALVTRLEGTKTFVIDEGYFLGCEDAEKLSWNLHLARACTDDLYGGFDIIFSGDEFQLTAPRATPLFDHTYMDLNSLNSKTRRIVTAIKNFWTITDCVILDEVVRQKNPRFVALLNRLRRGICTVNGEDNDLEYL